MSGIMINWFLGVPNEKSTILSFGGKVYNDPEIEDGTLAIVKDLDNVNWHNKTVRYKGKIFLLGHPDPQWKKYMKERFTPEMRMSMNYDFVKLFSGND